MLTLLRLSQFTRQRHQALNLCARFVVLTVLFAHSTSYAVVPTNTPQSGVNSDLFLAVVNQTTGKSEIFDLGMTVTSLTAGGQTINLDPNLFANLGAGTLTYQLVGGDISNALGNGFSGQILYVSGNTQYSGTNMNAQTISNALGSADAYLTTWNMTTVNGYLTFISTGSNNNWGPTNATATAPGKNLGQTGFDFTAPVGSSINFYSYTIAPSAADQPTTASTVTKLGTFTLSGSVLYFGYLTTPPTNFTWAVLCEEREPSFEHSSRQLNDIASWPLNFAAESGKNSDHEMANATGD